MANGFDKILESGFLNEETANALKEAWEEKVGEVKSSLRESVEKEVRQEFKEMYKNDSDRLVEAMDTMLKDAIQEYSKEQIEAAKALKEAKEQVTAELAESRKAYKTQLSEHVKALDQFVLSSLKEALEAKAEETTALQHQRVRMATEFARIKEAQKLRIKESMQDIQSMVEGKLSEKMEELNRKEEELTEAKKVLAKKLIEHRALLNTEAAENMNKLNKFVVSKLKEEIQEFQQDKKALNEQRVKFAVESKAKLAETRKQFIEKSSKLVSETVHSHLRKELTQLKEDIKIARENRFGRKIFEAMADEFISTRLSDESSKISQISEQLKATQEQLSEAKKLMGQQQVLVERAEKMAKYAKNDALRTKTLNELLRPLNKDKREIMESLLATTKTELLKESFNKLFPTVLNENFKPEKKRQTLSEQKTAPAKTREVTGDRTTRLNESAFAEDGQQTNEIINLRRLAGIE